jgi:protein-disulfide isomerase
MAKLKVPIGPDDHVQGPAAAPITLVEYGDYECPHCGHAYPIFKALQKRFGKQLRFAFRNFPLRQVQSAKGRKAQELLNKRLSQERKP